MGNQGGFIGLFFALILVLASVIVVVATRYKKCASNAILVVYGKTSSETSAKTIHGGGTFVLPLIQSYTYLSLEPLAVEVDLRGALARNNIRVDVPSTFTVGISNQQVIVQNAAQRLLGLGKAEIIARAEDIIIGQLRLVIATMTIEEISRDRETFLTSINENVNEELNKIGLDVINVNVRDITDESGYIEAIGKKAAAEAINRAKVDVAEQEKVGASGEAKANRERFITVAEEESMSAQGQKVADRDQKIRIAELDAEVIEGENIAKAKVAKYNSDLAVQEAEALRLGEVARAEAQMAVFDAEKATELSRLQKEQLAQIETKKKQIEIESEAEAERIRRIAKGEADAIFMKAEAEARGLQLVLDAKAAGYHNLVEGSGGSDSASTLLLIEKMNEIVKTQAEAISNLEIDKITVWDSGSGESGLKNFIKDFTTTLPPVHEIAKQAGLDLPKYLGNIDSNTIAEETAE